MHVLLTGGTGFVGRALTAELQHAVVLTRDVRSAEKHRPAQHIEYVAGDSLDEYLRQPERCHFDAVINLQGEPIASGRWTAAKKDRIRASRVEGTRQLIASLNAANLRPKVFISASAVGIYGDAGESVVNEKHAAGPVDDSTAGFLSDVCLAWEQAANQFTQNGVRVVNLRIGIVLGRDGGALAELIPIFRWGVGGRLGDGQQWMPWIHLDDLVALILWCIQQNTISGPVNATAPNPVRNLDFTKELGRILRRPTLLPAPRLGVRLALGEFANSLFSSQRVVPAAAMENGFHFRFPELRAALEDLLQ